MHVAGKPVAYLICANYKQEVQAKKYNDVQVNIRCPLPVTELFRLDKAPDYKYLKSYIERARE